MSVRQGTSTWVGMSIEISNLHRWASAKEIARQKPETFRSLRPLGSPARRPRSLDGGLDRRPSYPLLVKEVGHGRERKGSWHALTALSIGDEGIRAADLGHFRADVGQ